MLAAKRAEAADLTHADEMPVPGEGAQTVTAVGMTSPESAKAMIMPLSGKPAARSDKPAGDNVEQLDNTRGDQDIETSEQQSDMLANSSNIIHVPCKSSTLDASASPMSAQLSPSQDLAISFDENDNNVLAEQQSLAETENNKVNDESLVPANSDDNSNLVSQNLDFSYNQESSLESSMGSDAVEHKIKVISKVPRLPERADGSQIYLTASESQGDMSQEYESESQLSQAFDIQTRTEKRGLATGVDAPSTNNVRSIENGEDKKNVNCNQNVQGDDNAKGWISSRKDSSSKHVKFRLPASKSLEAVSNSSGNRLKDAIIRKNDSISLKKEWQKFDFACQQAARRGKSLSPAKDPVSFTDLHPHLWEIFPLLITWQKTLSALMTFA